MEGTWLKSSGRQPPLKPLRAGPAASPAPGNTAGRGQLKAQAPRLSWAGTWLSRESGEVVQPGLVFGGRCNGVGLPGTRLPPLPPRPGCLGTEAPSVCAGVRVTWGQTLSPCPCGCDCWGFRSGLTLLGGACRAAPSPPRPSGWWVLPSAQRCGRGTRPGDDGPGDADATSCCQWLSPSSCEWGPGDVGLSSACWLKRHLGQEGDILISLSWGPRAGWELLRKRFPSEWTEERKGCRRAPSPHGLGLRGPCLMTVPLMFSRLGPQRTPVECRLTPKP